MTSVSKAQHKIADRDFWAITTYFNPLRYERRLANFRIFREHLELPLVAVELAYGPEFELREQDAEILIQLRGGAVLWQKERLLNVALQALPGTCRKVAWLDCDILFDSPDWIARAESLLDQCVIIQAFRQAQYLSPRWAPGKDRRIDIEFTRPSAALTVKSGVPAAACIGHLLRDRRVTSATGFAWAARRELLERHGFFDTCIVGAGDRAMAGAAYGCFEDLMQRQYMNEQERRRYMNWAEPYYRTIQADVGLLNADIFHLWHGDISKRSSRTRHEGLQPFQFDPDTDIAIAENGAWRWNTDKHKMHEYIRSYFVSRQEDG
jgi:hypothetical protein